MNERPVNLNRVQAQCQRDLKKQIRAEIESLKKQGHEPKTIGLSYQGLQLFTNQPELLVDGTHSLNIDGIHVHFCPALTGRLDFTLNQMHPLARNLNQKLIDRHAMLALQAIQAAVIAEAYGVDYTWETLKKVQEILKLHEEYIQTIGGQD